MSEREYIGEVDIKVPEIAEVGEVAKVVTGFIQTCNGIDTR